MNRLNVEEQITSKFARGRWARPSNYERFKRQLEKEFDISDSWLEMEIKYTSLIKGLCRKMGLDLHQNSYQAFLWLAGFLNFPQLI
jgi:hypothetical protein